MLILYLKNLMLVYVIGALLKFHSGTVIRVPTIINLLLVVVITHVELYEPNNYQYFVQTELQ